MSQKNRFANYEKRSFEVTIVKTIDIYIHKDCLSEEGLNEFESIICKLNDKDTREDSLFDHCAIQVANYDDISFIEGCGPSKSTSSRWDNNEDVAIFYSVVDEEFSSDYIAYQP